VQDSGNIVTIGILLISVVVLISYVTDVYSYRLRVPTVLVLLGFGSLIHHVLGTFGIEVPLAEESLPMLGTIGLILIVLDASLHLEADPSAYRLVRKAIASALAGVVITSVGLAGILAVLTGYSFHICLSNALPFAVISSAMAIPSVKHIDSSKKEFVVYESTFSDIFGILAFTMIARSDFDIKLVAVQLAGSALLSLVLSILYAILLVWLVTRIRHQVKFFLVLFLILLAYSMAKLVHLPALLMVFLFGFAMANARYLVLWKPLAPHIDLRKVQVELRYTRLAAAELTFLVRTLFFTAFGFSIHWNEVFRGDVLQMAAAFLLVIYAVRWLWLRRWGRGHVFPETFISPRGLISVLLFLSLPASLRIPGLDMGVVVLVVVVSVLVMTAGLWRKASS